MTATMFRAAIVTAVVFAIAALAVMFMPTEKAGADCGTWPAPEFSDARMAKLADSYDDLDLEAMRTLGMGDDAAELEAGGRSIVAAKIACDDALSARRNATLGLLAGLLIVPGGMVFVSRAKND